MGHVAFEEASRVGSVESLLRQLLRLSSEGSTYDRAVLEHKLPPTHVCSTCQGFPLITGADVCFGDGHTTVPIAASADAMRAYLISVCGTTPAWVAVLSPFNLPAPALPVLAGPRVVPRAVNEVRRLIVAMHLELEVIPGNAEAARVLLLAKRDAAEVDNLNGDANAVTVVVSCDAALAAIDSDEARKLQSVEEDLVAADDGLERVMRVFDLVCDASDLLPDIHLVLSFSSLCNLLTDVLKSLRELSLRAGDAGTIIGGARGSAAVARLNEASHFALMGLVRACR